MLPFNAQTGLGISRGLFLGARVGRVVCLSEVLKIQPGVSLRGADVGVTEELLDCAQVTAGLQNVAGKGVAQHVGVHRGAQSNHGSAAAQAQARLVGVEAKAFGA